MKGLFKNSKSGKIIEIHCKAHNWTDSKDQSIVATDLTDRAVILIPASEFKEAEWTKIA